LCAGHQRNSPDASDCGRACGRRSRYSGSAPVAQRRVVRRHVDLRPGEPDGDVGGGDVRLLRREAALLERPRRHVADRPDAVDAADAAVAVDRDEAVGVVREAGQARSSERRQGDDEIRVAR
jgi:hypothetical protein